MSVAGLPMAQTIKLSAEQEAVLDWVKNGSGSLVLEAVAGSGKTFVLEQVAPFLRGTSFYAVFNKKNATEAQTKMGHVQGLKIGTCHSFGFGALRDTGRSIKVDQWRKRDMVKDYLGMPENIERAVFRLISLAKQGLAGTDYFPLDSESSWIHTIRHYDVLWQVEDDGRSDEMVMEELIHYAQRGVEWSMGHMHTIDFDDMLWLPIVKDLPFRRYNWGMLDECQDANLARQIVVRRMLKKGGRFIAVGDRNQAIYGFTGADSEALDHIQEDHDAILLPLSKTFRVSKQATELAQRFVPHIEAFDGNEEGSVRGTSFKKFWEEYVEVGNGMGSDNMDMPAEPDLGPGDAILCRLNRPLVALAFKLIKAGIGCHVEGRDIGRQLENMATKWKVKSVKALTTNLEAYRKREVSRLIARAAHGARAMLEDRIETLYIIMEDRETVDDVVEKIRNLFDDSEEGANTVVLSTVHKAKGREWDRVFILGYGEYMPSQWAKQEWEKRQERNLIYVAVTRTKKDLVLIADGGLK